MKSGAVADECAKEPKAERQMGGGSRSTGGGAARNSELDEKIVCFKEGCQQTTKLGRRVLEGRKKIRVIMGIVMVQI